MGGLRRPAACRGVCFRGLVGHSTGMQALPWITASRLTLVQDLGGRAYCLHLCRLTRRAASTTITDRCAARQLVPLLFQPRLRYPHLLRPPSVHMAQVPGMDRHTSDPDLAARRSHILQGCQIPWRERNDLYTAGLHNLALLPRSYSTSQSTPASQE